MHCIQVGLELHTDPTQHRVKSMFAAACITRRNITQICARICQTFSWNAGSMWVQPGRTYAIRINAINPFLSPRKGQHIVWMCQCKC